MTRMTDTVRAVLDRIDAAGSDAKRAELWQWIEGVATRAVGGYSAVRPSGTSCDVVSFAKAGGPAPRLRVIADEPAPLGDEFDAPREPVTAGGV